MSSTNAYRVLRNSLFSFQSLIAESWRVRRLSYLLLVGLALITITSCRDKLKVPSDVIKQEKMERILLDMIMADRFTAQYVLKDSAKKDVTKETFRIYSEVFSMHDITRDQFIRSYKFYMTRPDLTKIMFDTLMQRANRLKEESYRPKMDNPLDTSADRGGKDSLALKDSLRATDSAAGRGAPAQQGSKQKQTR